ncbi:MAG: hypothetical protein P4M00_16940 [Azospirillaceae bacterium]|nr:hypothetical protein [Azospirillaceae bacterium]
MTEHACPGLYGGDPAFLFEVDASLDQLPHSLPSGPDGDNEADIR